MTCDAAEKETPDPTDHRREHSNTPLPNAHAGQRAGRPTCRTPSSGHAQRRSRPCRPLARGRARRTPVVRPRLSRDDDAEKDLARSRLDDDNEPDGDRRAVDARPQHKGEGRPRRGEGPHAVVRALDAPVNPTATRRRQERRTEAYRGAREPTDRSPGSSRRQHTQTSRRCWTARQRTTGQRGRGSEARRGRHKRRTSEVDCPWPQRSNARSSNTGTQPALNDPTAALKEPSKPPGRPPAGSLVPRSSASPPPRHSVPSDSFGGRQTLAARIYCRVALQSISHTVLDLPRLCPSV